MRERLTQTAIVLYTLIMIVFSLTTISLVNGQYLSKKAEKIPDFTFQTLDGNKFTNNNLKKDSRLMIVYYNPLCEICQKETENIISNINFFDDIQILMISPNSKEEITKFRNDYKLNQYPQIIMLQDPSDLFYKQFEAKGYPSLYLYDEQKNILAHYDGYAEFEEVKEVFEEATSAKK